MFRTTSRPEQPPMPSPSAAPTHSRTTSAFSFFKRPSHNASLSTISVKEPLRQQSTALNEFGQRQPATTPSGAPQLTLGDKSPPPLPPGPSGQQSTTLVPQRMSTDNAERPTLPSNPGSNGTPTAQAEDAPLPPLHPEIRSVVQLIAAHGQKIYYSGPLIRRLERLPDGQRPTKDEGWHDVWAQLGGTTLSLWDMKEIEEASKQGKQVPPSYVNVTDAVSAMCRAIEDLYLRSMLWDVVSTSARLCNYSCNPKCPCEEIYECTDTQ